MLVPRLVWFLFCQYPINVHGCDIVAVPLAHPVIFAVSEHITQLQLKLLNLGPL